MSRYKKIYKFDKFNDAINPDVYEHTLNASKTGRNYSVKLTLFIAKNHNGFIYGFKMENVGSNFNSLPVGRAITCYYYNSAFGSSKRAILAALIEIAQFMGLEAYPISMIVQVGNLFVNYCQTELSEGAK